ncbi:MAG: hypothetical protein IPJ28_11580 [Betaproteobacteria bacterium]|nr:hypothetical protein [Betaproteobacteria bacterium]
MILGLRIALAGLEAERGEVAPDANARMIDGRGPGMEAQVDRHERRPHAHEEFLVFLGGGLGVERGRGGHQGRPGAGEVRIHVIAFEQGRDRERLEEPRVGRRGKKPGEQRVEIRATRFLRRERAADGDRGGGDGFH